MLETGRGKEAPSDSEPRIILVSNRLPLGFRVDGPEVRVVPTTGGLATGLRTPHERSGGVWVGWPGDVSGLSAEQRVSLESQLAARGFAPVALTEEEVNGFYLGYSNGILWPLFHYLLDRMPLDSPHWDTYRAVNERFADAVASRYREGDIVWVHDYHLLLVPEMLRKRIPRARIGFFLHIPFPSSEIFRILPRRAEVLRGLLGADLVGFHTFSYLRHFSMSLLRILGLEAEIDVVHHAGGETRIGVYPMGIDAAAFEGYVDDPEVRNEANRVRSEAGGGKILLGVERLDYTKGIPRRLLAFERLLEREPSFRDEVRLVQVATPSRAELLAYESFKNELDALVGRINGKYGTASRVPIHYISRPYTQKDLAALYLAADVMVVTSLRDGLNLVAKEYVACRKDLGGVLVISEFAGASAELPEAVVINPYDIDGVADALAAAIRMEPAEQAARMRAMRDRVRLNDVHAWVRRFLEDLSSASSEGRRHGSRPSSVDEVRACLDRIDKAERVVLLLDYDGTLVPLRPRPELAAPDSELLGLLERLTSLPKYELHLVSGRDRNSIESWLGSLPATLHAEHGLWTRDPETQEWDRNVEVSDEWKGRVRGVLDEFVKGTPRSFVEEKSAGIAWHYRQVDPDFGSAQAKELRILLFELLSNVPVQVIAGEKIVEVRAQGVNKGIVVARASRGPDALAVAMGDDRTDEDLFGALPEGSIAIHVGPNPSRAPLRLEDTRAARCFLRALADSR